MYSLKFNEPPRRVSPDDVARYSAIPAAVIGDSMLRIQGCGAAVKPHYACTRPLAGPAYTVKTRPGDNLFVHKAIDRASPGDVIVVDAGGCTHHAIVGEMMLTHAETRGLAGVVIYGAVRDSEHVAQHDFPVFASGVSQQGPFQSGPGHVNVPIAINGMVIMPGDLMIGDADGLICVPYDDVGPLYNEAHERFAGEGAQRTRVQNGTVERGWIDKRIEAMPYPVLWG